MSNPLDGIEALRWADKLMRYGQEPRPGPDATREEIQAAFERDIKEAKRILQGALDHQLGFLGGDTKAQILLLELMIEKLDEPGTLNRFGLSEIAHCYWFYLVNFVNNPMTGETLWAGKDGN